MKILLVTAMYPTPESPAFGSFVKTQAESLRRAGVDVEVFRISGRNQKLSYGKAILEVRRRVKRGDIDLIHAHYSFAGIVARMQRKVPVVVTYHGDDLLGTVAPSGNKTSWSVAVVAMGKILARFIDAAIVQNVEMASKISNANVRILPHEVDLDVFRPTEKDQARAELGLAKDKKYLLFAADPRISVKRFPLAKASADLLARRDPLVELLVVCKESQQRLALHMSACDALVFPSYQEGSPNIVKQAMACNLPIVATDVGDVREVVGQTEGCYICNPVVGEFTGALNEILKTCRRTNGREHVRHLNPSAVAEKLIQVYKDAIARHQTPARAASRTTFFAPSNQTRN